MIDAGGQPDQTTTSVFQQALHSNQEAKGRVEALRSLRDSLLVHTLEGRWRHPSRIGGSVCQLFAGYGARSLSGLDGRVHQAEQQQGRAGGGRTGRGQDHRREPSWWAPVDSPCLLHGGIVMTLGTC